MFGTKLPACTWLQLLVVRHGSGCILYHGELFICFLLVRILYQKPGRLNKGFFFLCLLMFLFFCVIWFAKGNCILLELSVQPSASKLECNFYDWILWINLKHANCSNKGFGEHAENPHSMWIELFEVIVYYYAGGCWLTWVQSDPVLCQETWNCIPQTLRMRETNGPQNE